MPRVCATAVLLKPDDKAIAVEAAPVFFRKLRRLIFGFLIDRKVLPRWCVEAVLVLTTENPASANL